MWNLRRRWRQSESRDGDKTKRNGTKRNNKWELARAHKLQMKKYIRTRKKERKRRWWRRRRRIRRGLICIWTNEWFNVIFRIISVCALNVIIWIALLLLSILWTKTFLPISPQFDRRWYEALSLSLCLSPTSSVQFVFSNFSPLSCSVSMCLLSCH